MGFTPFDEGNASRKLGPKVNAPYDLNSDATVTVVKLDPGSYSLEPTVAAHVIQGDAEGVGVADDAAGTNSAPVGAINTQAKMLSLATDVPAAAEVSFNVDDNDKYVAFIRQAGSGNGKLSINKRHVGLRA